eukprot:TRINITY_DN419_c0_g1_i3.p2 TRINITY_DN419_c0_g1~~TRINITY_DN419_c0_g1_i3.p2  ORF type:complete len:147 (+),score=1.25 TRINITY_DN419_c0_g1_i3:283-723(+)
MVHLFSPFSSKTTSKTFPSRLAKSSSSHAVTPWELIALVTAANGGADKITAPTQAYAMPRVMERSRRHREIARLAFKGVTNGAARIHRRTGIHVQLLGTGIARTRLLQGGLQTRDGAETFAPFGTRNVGIWRGSRRKRLVAEVRRA